MRADDLAMRFCMEPHVEGGSFIERNESAPKNMVRASSGVIYYHLGSSECSDFHVLDSDEYWLWHSGETLEIWMAEQSGKMKIVHLGVENDAQPCVFIRAGVIFGARHAQGAVDGTFVSCVTVPRFSYEHYRILPKEEMLKRYPESAAFYE